MTEFRKRYQNEPVDFHLWSQERIAEFWWRAALRWLKTKGHTDDYGDEIIYKGVIDKELEE